MILLSKTLHENVAYWKITQDANVVIINHGTITPTNNMSVQEVRIACESTTLAYKECLRRIKLKRTAGYIEVTEDFPLLHSDVIKILPEIKVDFNNLSKPMKCNVFRYNYMKHPSAAQPKINGCRCTLRPKGTTTTDLFDTAPMILTSKNGIVYPVQHILDQANKLIANYPQFQNRVFDGELYCFGYTAAEITGAAKNPKNHLHHKLVLIIFDLAEPNTVQSERFDDLNIIQYESGSELFPTLTYDNRSSAIYDPSINANNPIWLLETVIIKSDEEALTRRNLYLDAGFEGVVLRDLHAEYGFGQRVSTMLKWKRFEVGEFTIIDIYQRNDQDRLPLYLLKNDITDDTFESTSTGGHVLQHTVLPQKAKLVGKKVTLKYGERTVNNLPHHYNILWESINKHLNS